MSSLCNLKYVTTINDSLQLTITTTKIWLFSNNSFQEQNGRPISIEFLPFYPSNNNTNYSSTENNKSLSKDNDIKRNALKGLATTVMSVLSISITYIKSKHY